MRDRLKQSGGSKLSSLKRIGSCARSNWRINRRTNTELKSARRCRLTKSRGRSRFLPNVRRKNESWKRPDINGKDSSNETRHS